MDWAAGESKVAFAWAEEADVGLGWDLDWVEAGVEGVEDSEEVDDDVVAEIGTEVGSLGEVVLRRACLKFLEFGEEPDETMGCEELEMGGCCEGEIGCFLICEGEIGCLLI